MIDLGILFLKPSKLEDLVGYVFGRLSFKSSYQLCTTVERQFVHRPICCLHLSSVYPQIKATYGHRSKDLTYFKCNTCLPALMYAVKPYLAKKSSIFGVSSVFV